MALTISNSVGLAGANNPADVLAIKTRLVELGFSFVSAGSQMDALTIKAIKVFQAARNGSNSLNGSNGKVDVNGDTIKWLRAVNAPHWVQLPAGSAAEGFVNDNIADLADTHDFGTDWMAETLSATGATYKATYLSAHPGAALLHINDTSLPTGGDTPMHLGHEAGMASDIRLPRTDGGVGGITVHSGNYDRAAMRAMLQAFRSQELARLVFLNDQTLIKGGLCRHAAGHDNHAHFEIKPPARVDA